MTGMKAVNAAFDAAQNSMRVLTAHLDETDLYAADQPAFEAIREQVYEIQSAVNFLTVAARSTISTVGILEEALIAIAEITPIVMMPTSSDRQLDDMHRWCTENITNPWKFVGLPSRSICSGLAVFSCAEDAVMFKLRWGIA